MSGVCIVTNSVNGAFSDTIGSQGTSLWPSYLMNTHTHTHTHTEFHLL